MRNTLLAPLLAAIVPIAVAATASAAPSPLRPLVAEHLPPQCRDFAFVPASAETADPDFAAHISAASCLAGAEMSALTLHPNALSLRALEVATEPSRAILNEVIANGNDHWKAVAETAKATLLNAMAVRMRSVANDPGDRAGIELQLTRWQRAAARANFEAARLWRVRPVG